RSRSRRPSRPTPPPRLPPRPSRGTGAARRANTPRRARSRPGRAGRATRSRRAGWSGDEVSGERRPKTAVSGVGCLVSGRDHAEFRIPESQLHLKPDSGRLAPAFSPAAPPRHLSPPHRAVGLALQVPVADRVALVVEFLALDQGDLGLCP